MIDRRAGRRYAQALFELAKERGTLPRVDANLAEVRGLLVKHPEITHLVLNSTISQAEKEDFLAKILPADVDILALNFLKLLVKKKRFREFPAAQAAFHELYERGQACARSRP
jgi:F-type H+-transporting ATPase subunit delta